jgi:hypothetical protein
MADSENTDSPDSKADILLREAIYMLAPLARLMVANGVTYPAFAQALKRLFLDAAKQELADSGGKVTDSALSLLSGVHRKDVRTLGADPLREIPRAVSIAGSVVTRWITLPQCVDENGLPRPLPVRPQADGAPSFEALSQSVSKDFHSRSVLDELVRLGIAEENGDVVSLKTTQGFVPESNYAELIRNMSINVRDHLSAAALNVRAVTSDRYPPFLEYSTWADELSKESAEELERMAKKLWLSSMRRVFRASLELVERDRSLPAERRAMRFRYGGYHYVANGRDRHSGTDESERKP